MPGVGWINYADYYYCKKCHSCHQEYSKIGKEHAKYASNDHTKVDSFFANRRRKSKSKRRR